MEKMLSIEEVSRILDVKVSTIRAWCFSKKIPFFKVGRLVKFSEKQIIEWLNKRQVLPRDGS